MSSPSGLVERDENVQFAVEFAPDAMLRISSTGRIVYANRSAHDLLGYGPQELTSLEIFDIAPSYSRTQWESRCQQLREAGARTFETTYLTKQGRVVPVDVAVSHQGHGGEDFAEIVARDISAKKALEAQVLEIQDRERTRIGQDLHDNIGQRLTGIALSLDALRREMREQPGPWTERLGDIAAYTRETLNQTRSLAAGLAPISEHAMGLSGALEDLAASVRRTFSVDCALECNCSERIEDAFVANNTYRIAQEAIANAVKHGRATRITMVCGDEGGRFTLSIIDDGCGMDGPQDSGLGTRIMKHRARTIGGALEIKAGEPSGTVVRLICPLARDTC